MKRGALVKKTAKELIKKLGEVGQLEEIDKKINNSLFRQEVYDLLAYRILNENQIHVDERPAFFHDVMNEISAISENKEFLEKYAPKKDIIENRKTEAYKKLRRGRFMRKYLAGEITIGDFNKFFYGFNNETGDVETFTEQEDEIEELEDLQQETLLESQKNETDEEVANSSEKKFWNQEKFQHKNSLNSNKFYSTTTPALTRAR